MNLDKIKVVIFDLDGTLYEDTHHFDYYAERLKEKLSVEHHDSFTNDYQAVLNEEHVLKIGRVYDVEHDLVLVQINGEVKEAYKWDGTSLSAEKVQQLFPNKLTFDYSSTLNVGDLWWVPNAIARHYGLKGEQAQQAFFETREFMMTDAFQMNPVPNFKETLITIKEHVKLVLLTNSPELDSQQIITKLGLKDVFHLKIFEGRKPTKTEERFTMIKDYFDVSFSEILSVGDNWINEILPAKELGCKTIFIDAHLLGTKDSADLVVHNIGETIPVLLQLREK